MNGIMSGSMNTDYQRVTITMPTYLYRQVAKIAPPRMVSDFVSRAVEKQLLETTAAVDPVDDFLAQRQKLPKFTARQVRNAIASGRI